MKGSSQHYLKSFRRMFMVDNGGVFGGNIIDQLIPIASLHIDGL